MKQMVVILTLGLAGCAGGGDGTRSTATPPEAPAPVAVAASEPVVVPVVAPPTPVQTVDELLAAERNAFTAVAPPLHEAAAALIEEHRVQAEHLGGGPVIVALPTVGAVVARSRQVEYGAPVIDRLDRDPESISHPFTARVLVTCTVTTRESREVQAPAGSDPWQPGPEPSGDLPLPSAVTDAPQLPESLRPAAAQAAAECLTADSRSEVVVVALRFRFRLETGRWELDRERR